MALLDHFEQESNLHRHSSYAPLNENEKMFETFASLTETSGGTGGSDELKMFYLDRVEYEPSARIVDMAVSNGIIVMALENGRIVRIDLDSPQDLEEIQVVQLSQSYVSLFLSLLSFSFYIFF
jgi:Pep3/Vps18/deep orange beta-propeller domain